MSPGSTALELCLAPVCANSADSQKKKEAGSQPRPQMRTTQNFLHWERHTYAPQLVKAYIKPQFGHVTIAGDKTVPGLCLSRMQKV